MQLRPASADGRSVASTVSLRFLTRPVGLLAAAGLVGVLTIGGVLLSRPDGSDVALSEGAVDRTADLFAVRTTSTTARPSAGTVLLPGAAVPDKLAAADRVPVTEQTTTTAMSVPVAEPTTTPATDPAPPATEPTAVATTTTSTKPVRPGRVLVSDGQLVSVMLPDGSERRSVVQGRTPSWHPDGRRFAFAFDGAIWATDVDDPSSSRLIVRNGSAPVWSPDGSRLAFVRLVAGHDRVWVVDADGSNARAAVADEAALVAGRGPSWSPDGTRLVFAFGEPGSPASGLAIVTVDSGAPAEVLAYDSRQCCENSAPAWSPDGGRIAFLFVDVNRPGNPSAVRLLDLTNGAIADVLGGSMSGPAWAPDGLEVLARSSTGLAAASPTGASTARVVLTTGQLDDGAPSWR